MFGLFNDKTPKSTKSKTSGNNSGVKVMKKKVITNKPLSSKPATENRTNRNAERPKTKILKTKEERLQEARKEEMRKQKKRKSGMAVKYNVPESKPKPAPRRPEPEKEVVSESPKKANPRIKPLNKPEAEAPKKRGVIVDKSIKQRTSLTGKKIGKQKSAIDEETRPKMVKPKQVNKRENKKIEKRLKKMGLTDEELAVDAKAPIKKSTGSVKEKLQKGSWGYTPTREFNTDAVQKKESAIKEIKNEKILSRRTKLDSIKDINDISFFERINLVSYFNQKESGKLDEKEVREEYKRNTELLRKENSLKYFLLESARRNLEFGEFPEIKIQIDPKLEPELMNCMESKLLTSYEIQIERQHEILSKMNVDPIIISMRLRAI